MTKRLRKTAVLLIALSLIFGVSLNVYATSLENKLNDAEAEAQSIKSDKAAAESKLDSLNSKLSELNDSIADTQNKIQVKLEEIDQAEADLIQAMLEEQSQKKAMTLRIKYMYENDNPSILALLMESKDMGDFLNKTEYVESLSTYDREMLIQYQNTLLEIEAKKADLESEYENLLELQAKLEEDQAEVEQLVAEQESVIAELEAQLGEANDKIASLKNQIAAYNAQKASQNKQYSNSGSSSGTSGNYRPSDAGGSVVSGTGQFTNPCPGGYLSSGFGYRTFDNSFHKGIDLACPTGTPVYAADSGTVIISGFSVSAGNWIVISHGNGIVTKYMHNSALYVSAGQTVSKGQNIAAVGNTGYSFGSHCHFQVEVNGTAVNPYNYL